MNQMKVFQHWPKAIGHILSDLAYLFRLHDERSGRFI